MQFKLKNKEKYQRITTIDAHTEGEPLRIITDGYPNIVGDTILKKREYLLNNLDQYRQLLMFEPRGHADMYGALITEPCTEKADFGILFMHNEGYSSMCGHGIIAAVTVGVESGELSLTEEGQYIGIDAPAGFIRAYAGKDDNNNIEVSFDNVSSYVESLDQSVNVEGIGEVEYDIAFGGAYYAYVDADKLGIDCSPDNAEQLINWGRKIKHAVMAKDELVHPIENDLGFLYGTIFYSKKTDSTTSHSRHVCIFADGEVDRSPTGTGVSARIALLRAKEGLGKNEPVVIESIVGGKMTVEIVDEHNFEEKDAVTPRVSGRAFITGEHEFLLSSDDIFPQGFIIR